MLFLHDNNGTHTIREDLPISAALIITSDRYKQKNESEKKKPTENVADRFALT
jgi:hypothetical protein